MDNNFYPGQNGNGQPYEQNQYGGQQYAQPQYNNPFPQQNAPGYGAQPQYNQYAQPQYTNQQYAQGYNQPYGQQYTQPYGYNQGGYTAPPQKKPLSPVVISIPAVFAAMFLSAITSAFYMNGAAVLGNIVSVIINLLIVAAVGGFGFLAYKNLRGVAAFLGCYFLASCAAEIPAELLKCIIKTPTIGNVVLLLLTAVLTPVMVMLYDKLRDKTPQSLQNSVDAYGNPAIKKSLYNPLFIGIGVFAVLFINRLSVAITNHRLSSYLSYGNRYVTDSAISNLIINLVAILMIFAAGYALSKSFKKSFEFGGYVFVALRVAVILNTLFSAPSSNLVLGIFLALVASLVGAAAAIGLAFAAEGGKNKNV